MGTHSREARTITAKELHRLERVLVAITRKEQKLEALMQKLGAELYALRKARHQAETDVAAAELQYEGESSEG